MTLSNSYRLSKYWSLVDRSVADPRLPDLDHFKVLLGAEGKVKVFGPPNTLQGVGEQFVYSGTL